MNSPSRALDEWTALSPWFIYRCDRRLTLDQKPAARTHGVNPIPDEVPCCALALTASARDSPVRMNNRRIAIALAVAACSSRDNPDRDEPRWKTARTATVTFGDYVGTVPSGWREIGDLVDASELRGLHKQPGASILVPETWTHRDGQPSIILNPSTGLTFTPATDCEPFALTLAKQQQITNRDVTVEPFQGNPGCRWITKTGELPGRVVVWARGSTFHFAQCLFPEDHKDAVEVCERFLADLKLR